MHFSMSMLISFFEEFPNNENLKKIELVTWKTRLYIAAKSVDDFERIKKKIRNKQVVDVVYWPLLAKSEGYWISPFAHREALLRIFNELQHKQIPVMLDLELPTRHNPWLYLTQLLMFFSNKRLIRKFIQTYPRVMTAEYYPRSMVARAVKKMLGLHFSCPAIRMLYQSEHHFSAAFLEKELKNEKIVGFGLLAPGIFGGRTLTPDELEKNLEIARKCGMEEVVLYRLGGLDRYCDVIKKFI